jgi:CHAT domain-containing protein/tetratricopeptide (TPR) repeat protein
MLVGPALSSSRRLVVSALVICAYVGAIGRAASPQSAPPSQTESTLAEATRLHEEGERQLDSRQYKEASETLERALALRRQALGEAHPDVARSMKSLANGAYGLGNYPRAEELLQGALTIAEAALGPNDLFVAQTLSDLAAIFQVRGDYVKPEPLYQRALTIYEKVPAGSADSDDVQESIASALGNLGSLYLRRRDFARAEANYIRVLAIRERLRGANDASVATTLADLGGVYYVSEQYQKAIEILQRAIAIQEKVLPPNHPAFVTSFNNLANVYYAQGDYANAVGLLQRALAIDEKNLDPRHPRLAARLHALAEALRLQGEYERAEPLYERAQTIREQALGPSHPDFANTLIAHSLLRQATGDFAGAVALMAQGSELREGALELVMTSGSQDDKRLYLGKLLEETDMAVSLHLASAPSSTAASALALNDILRRKGRPLDAMADQFAALRRRLNPDDQQLLARLSTVQSQLAGLVLRGVSTPAQQERVAKLRDEIQQLEKAISTRSAEFRAASHVATIGEIQNAMPTGSVLVELASYRPFFVKKARGETFGPPRYAAYVVSKGGIVASVDLGEASEIDQRVLRFRSGLSNPSNRDVDAAAQALYQSLIQPIEGSLNGAAHVFISPDGSLNLIPFAALRGADGKYLIERFTISYVTSGRDFLRFQDDARDRPQAGGPPMVVANPSFDGLPPSSTTPTPERDASTRAVDAAVLEQALKFKPLPGTAQEASALQKVLPEARVYTGAAATEALLKQSRAPSILHIATHGFFLRPAATATTTETRGLTAAGTPSASPSVDRSDALVLSGLALAGANQRSSGEGQDGILTALEASGLDLWGTRMVVLSACETGVGDARNGEGVYGLRRALVLAGSESQVMSLWQVSDAATTDLMVAYYKRLRTGEGRAEALRNVQREFARGGSGRSHPFYWASFIQSGDWRPTFN